MNAGRDVCREVGKWRLSILTVLKSFNSKGNMKAECSHSSCGGRAIRRVGTGYGKERQIKTDMLLGFLVIGSH